MVIIKDDRNVELIADREEVIYVVADLSSAVWRAAIVTAVLTSSFSRTRRPLMLSGKVT